MNVYGIDFGSTYTVVAVSSAECDGQIEFIKFNDSVLFSSDNSGVHLLKRVILNTITFETLAKDHLLQVLIAFFQDVKKIIIQNYPKEVDFNCVLTIPVRFDDCARYFIKFAAIKAGLNVVKLLQEPVAAAIAVVKDQHLINGDYIVYDLGGGTFDASLVRKYNELIHVIKVAGLASFGGKDIDEYIAHTYSLSLLEAEQKKCDVFLPELDNLLQKTYDIVHDLIVENLKGIILIGGSSYLKNIENYYADKYPIIKCDDLQTLVAKGAALYGAEYLNESQFLIDVTPFNLGIEVLGDSLEVLIPANSPIPFKVSELFIPVDNKVVINVLQGDSLIASECKVLGQLAFESKEQFQVDFILDCDGVLTVQVFDKIFILSNLFNE